jgi:hypothetical protein
MFGTVPFSATLCPLALRTCRRRCFVARLGRNAFYLPRGGDVDRSNDIGVFSRLFACHKLDSLSASCVLRRRFESAKARRIEPPIGRKPNAATGRRERILSVGTILDIDHSTTNCEPLAWGAAASNRLRRWPGSPRRCKSDHSRGWCRLPQTASELFRADIRLFLTRAVATMFRRITLALNRCGKGVGHVW